MTFTQQIYSLVRLVPAGRVITYGLAALWLGRPRSARAVGTAMSRCPYEDVPCHRVLNAQGRLAPFPAFGTGDGQRMLLEMEGIPVSPDGRVDLTAYVWRPTPDELRNIQRLLTLERLEQDESQ